MAKIIINNYSIKAQIAVLEHEQARGLMHQEWPPPVMAFVYNKASINKFWMKDTPSPLDVVFCHDGKIISIESGAPYSEKLIGGDFYSDLVVELPNGVAAALDFSVGTPIELMWDTLSLCKKYAIKHTIK